MPKPLPPVAPVLRAVSLALLCLLPAAWPGAVFATTVTTQAQEQADPPGRVGRLADLQGQVWLYHPEAGDWISAERNRPLTSGDRLATDAGGRAEVRIGSTTLRLDSGSELEVLQLDDDHLALQLHSGSLAVRVRNREVLPEFDLRTGEGRFTLQRTGRYRFDRADDASHLTVYAGQALYEGQGSALTVNAGQRAEFWLDSANVAQYSIVEPARDAFASWNAERDRADDRSASTRYVSPEMTGVEDLDRYGRWEQNDEYGALWVPRVVAPGWAPYSTGRWAWVAPWGWTWVDDAPWGFAPFHYGRWVYVGSNWCWSPGTYVRRPVYAPALVAWIGGPRLSVAVNIGATPSVGWVPLAPREVYVPGYRVSPRYVRNVNITHVTNITNITTIVSDPQRAVRERDYSNRKFPHAVTVVPASVIEARQPVAPAARPWRDAPGLREITREPPRNAALVAPPVTVTPPPRRAPDAPIGRPPGWQRDAGTPPPRIQRGPAAELQNDHVGVRPIVVPPRERPAPAPLPAARPPVPPAAVAPAPAPAPAPAARPLPAPAPIPAPAPAQVQPSPQAAPPGLRRPPGPPAAAPTPPAPAAPVPAAPVPPPRPPAKPTPPEAAAPAPNLDAMRRAAAAARAEQQKAQAEPREGRGREGGGGRERFRGD